MCFTVLYHKNSMVNGSKKYPMMVIFYDTGIVYF